MMIFCVVLTHEATMLLNIFYKHHFTNVCFSIFYKRKIMNNYAICIPPEYS